MERRCTDSDRASELLAICRDAISDSVLSDTEVRRVLRWLVENNDVNDPGIASLTALAKDIAADGKVSTEERSRLLVALEAFQSAHTKPNEQPTAVALPATERQKEYAVALGVVFQPDITRRELSKLIDAAIEKREDERFKRLDALESRERQAKAQLREEILAELDSDDCRLSRATAQQMVDELARRDLGAVLVTFQQADVEDFERLFGVEFTMVFPEDAMTETDMRLVLMTLGMGLLQRRV